MAAALLAPAAARAQGPEVELGTAFREAFAGLDACVVMRDVAAGAQVAISDEAACARRLPPCATFEIAANVVALDRGAAPDVDAPLRRDLQRDPPQPKPQDAGAEPTPAPVAASLRDAARTPSPWLYEELARRIGPDAFPKALNALRYGGADLSATPVDRMWLGETDGGLRLSPVEQVDFLARLKRGELPTSAESQARALDILPAEKTPEGQITLKGGECGPAAGPKVAWAVGWVERQGRSTLFAAAETAPTATTADAVGRTRALLRALSLLPPEKP
ncbi:beta-lactamase class D [Methylopila jiangsuensis]|uniref:penicillin-binding transpeptidase domain-containing protein n=1 Tax=Methylopila jiangsuensis TaxID=586230 RepID=UPI0022F30634|nr:penicillin-binding transpeptidase domain-containing protein [Methylopila jiangsuensis]MDR6284443.1 beta-lactamase class D [Methylopila jiangsuensis]